MAEEHKTRYTLLQRALDTSDEDAWEELVAHYRRFILYLLHRLNVNESDVEDIAQQVLIRLLKELPNYNREKGRFHAWLTSIIRNASIDYFRRSQSRQRKLDGLREESADSVFKQPEIEKRIEREWAAYITNEAMERVKAVFQGEAIHAFELGLEGMSASQIAEETGLTPGSVYVLRQRVKKRLYLEVLEITADLEG